MDTKPTIIKKEYYFDNIPDMAEDLEWVFAHELDIKVNEKDGIWKGKVIVTMEYVEYD